MKLICDLWRGSNWQEVLMRPSARTKFQKEEEEEQHKKPQASQEKEEEKLWPTKNPG